MSGSQQDVRFRFDRALLIGGGVAFLAAVVLVGYAATILIPSISRKAEIRDRLTEVSSDLQTYDERRARAEAEASGSRTKSYLVRRLEARSVSRGISEEQIWRAEYEQRRAEGRLRQELESLTSEREQVADRTHEGIRFGVIGVIAFAPGVVLLVAGLIVRAVGRTARPEAALEVEEFVPS